MSDPASPSIRPRAHGREAAPVAARATPVSVHILTRNSAKTLSACLASLTDLHPAEIIVADGGSTDETVTIAKKAGARVIPQPQTGPITDFSAARNALLTEAKQPWILALDSDETLSPGTGDTLAILAVTATPAAYLVPRKYVLPDRRVVDHASSYPNARIYFFHRDTVTGWEKPVHERPMVKAGATVRMLKGATLAPIGTPEDYKAKNLSYLRIEAKRDAGKDWSYWLTHRVLHTLRSRLIGLVRIAGIWLVPRRGTRLPLRYELLRFWYGWRLIAATAPSSRRKQ